MIEIRSLRRTVAALLLPAIGGLVACREPDIVQVRQPDPLRVVLSPSPVGVCEGMVVTLSVEVRGDSTITERAVRFSIADATVAEIVNQTDVEATIRGLATGATTIFAALATDAAIADSAGVSVTSCTSPTPTVAVASITAAGTSTAVDRHNVSGAIDLHYVSDSLPAGSTLELVVDATPAADCAGPAANGAGTCTVNTAAVDGRNNALFGNGERRLTVRAVRSDGVVVASTSALVTLSN